MNIQHSIKSLISEEELSKSRELLENATNIIILTHLSPDGDALGSSLALYHYLKQKGKEVRVIVPNSFPYFLRWMDGTDNIIINNFVPQVAEALIRKSELIFCLDFNVLKRIGELGKLVEDSTSKKILIDHHLHPEDAFDVKISYPQIASTSEIIFRLLLQWGEIDNISSIMAECIYTGMMTDTGAFTFNSNDAEMFEIVSILIKHGINRDKIYRKVFNNYSEQRFRLLGYTLSNRMKLYPDYRATLLYLSKEDQKQFDINKGDTEGFVNYPLNIKDITFSVFIREDDELVKVSLRSQGTFPCNEFAADFFNGGGHLNASGGEFYGSVEEAINIFEKGLKIYSKLLNP